MELTLQEIAKRFGCSLDTIRVLKDRADFAHWEKYYRKAKPRYVYKNITENDLKKLESFILRKQQTPMNPRNIEELLNYKELQLLNYCYLSNEEIGKILNWKPNTVKGRLYKLKVVLEDFGFFRFSYGKFKQQIPEFLKMYKKLHNIPEDKNIPYLTR